MGSVCCRRLVVVTPHQVNRFLLVRRRNELVHVLAVCARSVNERWWKEKTMNAKTKPQALAHARLNKCTTVPLSGCVAFKLNIIHAIMVMEKFFNNSELHVLDICSANMKT